MIIPIRSTFCPILLYATFHTDLASHTQLIESAGDLLLTSVSHLCVGHWWIVFCFAVSRCCVAKPLAREPYSPQLTWCLVWICFFKSSSGEDTRSKRVTQNWVRFAQNQALLDQHIVCATSSNFHEKTAPGLTIFLFCKVYDTERFAILSVSACREIWNEAEISTKSLFQDVLK